MNPFKAIFIACTAAAIVLMPHGLSAATHYVAPSGGHVAPFASWANAATNIQAAVDAAVAGDTVLVTNGVYRESTNIFVYKDVSVRSMNGPQGTIVDGLGMHRCFYMTNGTVSGFTITNGFVSWPTAMPVGGGGGIMLFCGGTVSNCVIVHNSARNGGGGAGNGDGGGVACVWGGTLVDSLVCSNYAEHNGGAVRLYGGGLVRNCIVSNNTANYFGGGLCAELTVTVENCAIVDNTAISGAEGGGMIVGGEVTVANCLVARNRSIGGRGGAAFFSGDARMMNCTIVSNVAGTTGGGFYFNGGNSLVINSVVNQNGAGSGDPNVVVGSGSATFLKSCSSSTLSGSGNIVGDPKLVSVATGDYHLQTSSPCINAGSNMAWMVTAKDLDGNSRLMGGQVDMGAYEYVGETGLYAVVDISSGPAGTSYPVTYFSSQPALNDEYKMTKILLRRIPAGSFVMGSPTNELGRQSNEGPQHVVTLSSNFYMGVFEITQAQYTNVMGGTNPSVYPGATRPIEWVSWNTIRGGMWPGGTPGAGTFMEKMRTKTGISFDLPTEAQWEYASRAGTTNALHNNTNLADINTDANLDVLGRYYNNGGSASQHVPVGSYQVNNWGIYDMHGNVWEWCLDWYTNSYGGNVTDPSGPATGTSRCIRGGSWVDIAWYCRSAFRSFYTPENLYSGRGFRLCMPSSDGSGMPLLTNGLIAYYPFNGNANDESGNDHHGVLSNGAAAMAADRFGASNAAAAFDGVDDFVHVTGGGWLPTGAAPRSVVAWTKLPAYADFQGVFGFGAASSMQLFMMNGRSDNNAMLDLYEGGPHQLLGSTICDGTWHFVAGVYDGTNASLWVDGVCRSNVVKSINTAMSPFYIGKMVYAAYYARGPIDDVRIYNRALASNEVAMLYNVPGPVVQPAASDGIHTNKVTVTWSSANGADRYMVYRSTRPFRFYAAPVSSELTTTNYEDTTVVPSQEYFYWVKAGNGGVWSDLSRSDRGYAGSLWSGRLASWGTNFAGETTVQTGNNFVAIRGGGSFTVALRADGTIQAWGGSADGQTNSPAGTMHRAIATGLYHGMALREDGSVVAWGYNAQGQTSCPAGNDYAAIAGGGQHSLAVRADGTLAGWGMSTYGQLNLPGGSSFVAVAGGETHSVALRADGLVVAWGCQTDYGQTNCSSGSNCVAIAAGQNHTLALRADGSLVAWGDNSKGQTTCPVGIDFIAIASSWNFNAALRSNGTMVAWGDNSYGQLNYPTGTDYRRIGVGNSHGFVIRDNPTNEAPIAPLGVAASDGVFSNKVVVAWSASSNATKYALWRNTANSTNGAANISGDIAAANYADMAVVPGSTYWYWVKAGNAVGWSGPSVGDSGYVSSGLYVVVDVSAGPAASNYPVSYHSSLPVLGAECRTTKILLRRIPAGTFAMGAPTGELGRESDEQQHGVTLSRDYYMGVFEITQAQYTNVMGGTNPSAYQGATRPVEQVSWTTVRGGVWPSGLPDTSSFMGRLGARTDLAFDLPTEAQWEYACRAGTTNALNNNANLQNVNQDAAMDLLGCYQYNGGTLSNHVVPGAYLPNSWGLYDMHGNEWELCLDWYSSSYGAETVDPSGAPSGAIRAIRGGYWNNPAWECRSANRASVSPGTTMSAIGFRIALAIVLPSDLTNGLVAYYPFNGNASDESGCGNHGTVSGAVLTAGISGESNTGYQFDGTDDFITVGTTAFLPTGNTARSMFAWVRSRGPQFHNMTWLSYGEFAASQLCALITDNLGHQFFWTYTGGSSLVGNSVVADGAWHHVGVTFDGATLTLYLDGVPDGTRTCTLNTANPAANPFTMGRKCNAGESYYPVDGTMDEVRFYNYALSPKHVRVLFGLAVATPFVDITNAPSTVANATTTCSVAGTNNAHVVGGLQWTNGLNGANGSIPVSSFEFQVSAIPLAEGTNIILVVGTNTQGTVASDSVMVVRQPPVPAPSAPISIAATDGLYTNKVAVYWSASTNATMYAVWRNASASTNGSSNISGDITATNYDDTAVVPGTTYWYWAKAGNAGGWSGFSTNDSGYAAFPEGTGAPFLDVTTMPVTVSFGVTSYTVAGTNNAHVVGRLQWTNGLNGANGSIPVSSFEFQVSAIPLSVGTNTIAVSGTNAWGWLTNDAVAIVRQPTPPSNAVHYVALAGTHVVPFTSWATAATNIQAAVDAAVAGDTVLVTNGVYREATNIFVYGDITVRSVNGPQGTTIDGMGMHRCFYMTNGILSGLTLTNGFTAWSSTVSVGGGGGVMMFGAGTVSNCVVVGNGVRNSGSGAGDGGGIACIWGGMVVDSLIWGNYAEHNGGGIRLHGGGTVRTCIVSNNSAAYFGGGLCLGATSTVENCAIVDNTMIGANEAAGLMVGGGATLINNCLVARNKAPGARAGGIMVNGDPTMINCTVVSNMAGTTGGGFYFIGGSSLIINCIVDQNGAGSGDPNVVIGSGSATFLKSCSSSSLSGSGNILGDPRLVNGASGDYHLQMNSPCIDAGTNMAWMATATDLDGNPRVRGGTVDIGAYEIDVLSLNPPSGVSASDGTYTDKVVITWSPSSNATKYSVWWNTANNTGTASNISGDITDTSFDDTFVSPGVTYWYWVMAGNGNGWSDFSVADSGYALYVLPTTPEIQPAYLDFSTNLVSKNVVVANAGGGSFTFTNVVLTGTQWLSVLPLAGTVSSQAVPLVASVNRASMPNGSYTGLVSVTPSVGSPVVVTCRMEVAGNSVVAVPGGPYVADQGSPVVLDASASLGNNLSFSWRVIPGSWSDPSPSNKYYSYTGYIPRTNAVMLLIEDDSLPPLSHTASTLLMVRNVAPVVDAGGPYTGTVNRSITFQAAIADPGTGDTHEIRWEFGTGWTAWRPASAISITNCTFAVGGGYPIQCEVRDNHGGIGSDTATVMVDVPNQPPTAVATLGSPGVVYSNYGGMHVSALLDGSGSVDARTATSNLFFDWREDVDNPAKPLLSDAARQQSNAVITFFPLPGVYRFHLVVNDGEYNSEPATVQANIPGLAGRVKSDGIGAVLPLYGVTLTVTNQALGQVFTETTDMEGKFALDTGGGNGRIVGMDRNGVAHVALVNVDADGIRNYILTYAPRVCSFTALVNSGFYGGAYAPIAGAYAQIVIGSEVGFNGMGDLTGQIPFGGVPELWPRNATVNYQVLYQKQGWQSQLQPLQPDPAMPAAQYPTLFVSDACTVQGLVVGTNNLPARDIAVNFGPAFNTVLTDADGRFTLSGLMRGVYYVKLSASDFETTFTTVNIPPGDTTITLPQPLVIRGGRFSVYGEICNSENGMPIFNATARIVVNTNTKMLAMLSTTSSVASTRTGYYDLPVVKGARTMVIEAPGYEPRSIPINAEAHVQQPVQLAPVPEPAIAGAVTVIGYWLFVWRRREG